MNNKQLYLFNTVKSVQYLKSFRPSSTPFYELSSPGLSNVNIHSFLVQSHFSTSNLVYQKSTTEENKKTEFVQEGKGIDNEESIFDPIQVDRTVLEGMEVAENEEKNVEITSNLQTGAAKRKMKCETKAKKHKKPRTYFKIVD